MAIQFGNSAWQYRIARMKEKEATNRQREAVPLQLALGLGKALFSMGSTMGTDAVKYFGMGGKEEQKGRMDLASAQTAQAGAATERFQAETLNIPKDFKLREGQSKREESAALQQAAMGKAQRFNVEAHRRRVESAIGKPLDEMTPEEIARGEDMVVSRFKEYQLHKEGSTLKQFKPGGSSRKSDRPTKQSVNSLLKESKSWHSKALNAEKSGVKSLRIGDKSYTVAEMHQKARGLYDQAVTDAKKVRKFSAPKTFDDHIVTTTTHREGTVETEQGASVQRSLAKDNKTPVSPKMADSSRAAKWISYAVQGITLKRVSENDFNMGGKAKYGDKKPGTYFLYQGQLYTKTEMAEKVKTIPGFTQVRSWNGFFDTSLYRNMTSGEWSSSLENMWDHYENGEYARIEK